MGKVRPLSEYSAEELGLALKASISPTDSKTKEELDKLYPGFAHVFQELRERMHDEVPSVRIEQAFNEGMYTVLNILDYLEKR